MNFSRIKPAQFKGTRPTLFLPAECDKKAPNCAVNRPIWQHWCRLIASEMVRHWDETHCGVIVTWLFPFAWPRASWLPWRCVMYRYGQDREGVGITAVTVTSSTIVSERWDVSAYRPADCHTQGREWCKTVPNSSHLVKYFIGCFWIFSNLMLMIRCNETSLN